MAKIRVFTSFDLEHDRDLYELLLLQSQEPGSGFEIVGCSRKRVNSDLWDDELRAAIARADEMVVICGVHTCDSMRVGAELGIAQETDLPYFLLWGRRELMCTKPSPAKNDDGIYSWTPRVLADQLIVTMRRSTWTDVAATVRRPPLVREPKPAAVEAVAERSE